MAHTRRDFLAKAAQGAACLSFAPWFPRFLARSAAASVPDARDSVLVVVQLSGGNDGLNTIVPYADDAYARSRSTLRLPADQVHKVNDQLGFHPRMEALYRLYRDGVLTVAQGVGYPNSNRSHPGAMRIWHTADPNLPGPQTGWLGRVADGLWNEVEANVPALFVSPIPRPLAMNAATVIIPRIGSPRDLVAPHSSAAEKKPAAGANHPWIDSLRLAAARVHDNSRRIEALMDSPASGAGYPQFQLAADLHTIARLIRADAGIRIFFTELGGGGIGGFDNHAGQLGNHCALLHQLSESVSAFARDLQGDNLFDRVLLLTFSEFGRTLHENGRRGTGHGAAAPLFLAGGKVKGGLLGPHPSLTELDNDGLKFHTDFRRLYAAVLDGWLGIDSSRVLGASFPPLDFLKT